MKVKYPTPPCAAPAVANRFLALARRDGAPIDHLKLQKLIYCAHGWYLAFTGRPLLQEHVEAWQYGPVIPTVYHIFKRFGGDPIDQPAFRHALDPLRSSVVHFAPYEVVPGSYEERVIDEVWKAYGKYSGTELSNLTHREGTAWYRMREEGLGGRLGTDMPDDWIAEEFQGKWNAIAQPA